ncbi:MAG: hypothetical protein A2234_01240 [Elusimicrobia bacterium RIFOXYA2_FULL_58_8]|nr:MAG: hypothetical protein A2285_09140 [Elusimicrobia bacterium RIFOXYA12_FULL_57_11]OGS16954.1 MAG: hypothetical protein A2234_01240 [Elusimicrobia bacterium RIFOXYA2_FULL_58_8]
MNTILIICAVTATLAFVALAIQAILTLQQVRHTAQAVEFLALNADGKLTALDPVMDTLKSVSGAFTSGWFKIAQAAYGLFARK